MFSFDYHLYFSTLIYSPMLYYFTYIYTCIFVVKLLVNKLYIMTITVFRKVHFLKIKYTTKYARKYI